MAYSLTYSYNSTSQSYTVTGSSNIATGDKVVIPATYNDGTNGEHPVTSIDSQAFYNRSKLTSVAISNGVTSIGSNAFAFCTNLASVDIPDSVTSIGTSAFYSCSKLTSVVIPAAVTSINALTFGNCSKLASIKMPSELTSIGNSAFDSCYSLTSIIIPENVTSIGEYTFYSCRSLTNIILDNVTSIGTSAFSDCTKLAQLILFPSTPPTLGSSAIPSTIQSIYVKQSSKAAYQAATNWAAFATKIVGDNLYLSFVRFNQKNKEYIEKTLNSSWDNFNLENGTGLYSLVQKYIKDNIDHSPVATGIDSVAFGGLRFDYDPERHSDDTTNIAAGNQSFVAGCGNYTAGDWSFVAGKDNTVYSNRAFVFGGANISQGVDSGGNLLEAKTDIGRFNAIFGNNNTFKSSKISRESNLIAGGSNTVDTERSIVVGYNNDVTGYFDAVFGFKNVVNADYSLTGGQGHIVNGGYHLVAGSGNEVSGQYNIASGQDNENLGWNGAVIGRGLIVGETHTSQTVLGQYNDNKSDTVLEIGWGDVNNRKNIFEVYRDGVVKTEKGTLSTEEYARSYTDSVVAPLKNLKKLNVGTSNTDADAVDSLTVGQHSLNRGAESAAIGYDAYVGYDSSGNPLPFRPTGAIALGWSRANADYSLSAGYDTEVNHQKSVALNNKTKTGISAQTVVGSFNVGKNNTAFEVGNGTSETDRKNAFEVLQDGRAKVQTAPVENDDVVRKGDLTASASSSTGFAASFKSLKSYEVPDEDNDVLRWQEKVGLETKINNFINNLFTDTTAVKFIESDTFGDGLWFTSPGVFRVKAKYTYGSSESGTDILIFSVSETYKSSDYNRDYEIKVLKNGNRVLATSDRQGYGTSTSDQMQWIYLTMGISGSITYVTKWEYEKLNLADLGTIS